MDAANSGDGRRPLSGWRAIAAYLGCNPSTAKRWAASRGLPVHRPQEGESRKGATVYAFPDELTAWIRRHGDTAPADGAQAEAGPSDPRRAPDTPSQRAARRSSPGVSRLLLALCLVAITAGAIGLRLSSVDAGQARGAAAAGADAIPEQARADHRAAGYLWPKRTPETLTEAQKLLTAAVEAAPSFAGAWSDLAMVYDLCVEYGVTPAAEGYALARLAAERAIMLDPQNAQALSVLGDVAFFWSRDYENGLGYFDRAAALNPGDVTTRHWRAAALMAAGRFDEAEREVIAARELDPQSRSIIISHAMIALGQQRATFARELLMGLVRNEPNYRSPWRFMAFAELSLGDFGAFLDAWETRFRLTRDEAGAAVVAVGKAAWVSGDRARTVEAMLAAALDPPKGAVEPYFLAHVTALAGRSAEAADLLGVIKTRHFTYYRIDPAFDAARRDPDFLAKAAAAGLPVGG